MSNTMQCGDNLKYSYNYGKLSIVGLEGSPSGAIWDDCPPNESWDIESVHIPEGVTRIGNNCFTDRELNEVYLPYSLESIGDEAFAGCENLEEIDIPNGLLLIGERAFAETGLSSVEIPKSVENVYAGAFENCDNLNYVSVNAQNIHENAFSHSAISEVQIGKNVTSIGDGAFQNNDIRGKINLTHVSELGDNAFDGSLNAEFIATDEQVVQLQGEGLNAHTPNLQDLIDEAKEEAANQSVSFEPMEFKKDTVELEEAI